MNDIYKGYLATKNTTPQREQARPEQVRNYAGGYVFETKAETAVDRFLLLGTDKPTYYASAQTLTREAAGAVEAYAASPGNDLVDRIVAVSKAGRAPKNSPALLALAIAASVGDTDTQSKAFLALPDVARTSTHLFEFVEYLDSMRGWGRAPRRAVAEWYTTKTPDQIAYQAVKYRQRNGWTHRDVLRLAHPEAVSGEQDLVFNWITRPEAAADRHLPKVIGAYEAAKRITTGPMAAALIKEFNLPWEALPDSVINTPAVWKALVPNMGMTALMRNLSRVARLDDHKAAREIESMMVERLTDPETIRKARLHPINILVAMRTYAAGRSAVTGPYNAIARNFGGGSTWTPNRHVTDALDKAYYDSFQYQEPTGKRILYALDVSGSMGIEVKPGLTARDAAAAMALATLSIESNVDVVGFTSGSRSGGWRETGGLSPLDLSPRRRLDDNILAISGLDFGRTDCALPAKWAAANRKDYDVIVIATDNETWAGNGHPFQALQAYRKQVGHRVAQIVVAMTATDFTIADPKDPDSLDVVGFDSALPGLIAEFSK